MSRNCLHCESQLIPRKYEEPHRFSARKFCSHKCFRENKIANRANRFFKQTKINLATGCLEWTGCLSHGYGRLTLYNKQKPAHRYAMELAGFVLTTTDVVMRKCDNPKCVNVDHLVIGTHALNAADKMAKKRAPIGSQRSTAKLTEEVIPLIRADKRSQEKIAAAYSVTRGTIRDVLRGKSWCHA